MRVRRIAHTHLSRDAQMALRAVRRWTFDASYKADNLHASPCDLY